MNIKKNILIDAPAEIKISMEIDILLPFEPDEEPEPKVLNTFYEIYHNVDQALMRNRNILCKKEMFAIKDNLFFGLAADENMMEIQTPVFNLTMRTLPLITIYCFKLIITIAKLIQNSMGIKPGYLHLPYSSMDHRGHGIQLNISTPFFRDEDFIDLFRKLVPFFSFCIINRGLYDSFSPVLSPRLHLVKPDCSDFDGTGKDHSVPIFVNRPARAQNKLSFCCCEFPYSMVEMYNLFELLFLTHDYYKFNGSGEFKEILAIPIKHFIQSMRKANYITNSVYRNFLFHDRNAKLPDEISRRLEINTQFLCETVISQMVAMKELNLYYKNSNIMLFIKNNLTYITGLENRIDDSIHKAMDYSQHFLKEYVKNRSLNSVPVFISKHCGVRLVEWSYSQVEILDKYNISEYNLAIPNVFLEKKDDTFLAGYPEMILTYYVRRYAEFTKISLDHEKIIINILIKFLTGMNMPTIIKDDSSFISIFFIPQKLLLIDFIIWLVAIESNRHINYQPIEIDTEGLREINNKFFYWYIYDIEIEELHPFLSHFYRWSNRKALNIEKVVIPHSIAYTGKSTRVEKSSKVSNIQIFEYTTTSSVWSLNKFSQFYKKRFSQGEKSTIIFDRNVITEIVNFAIKYSLGSRGDEFIEELNDMYME